MTGLAAMNIRAKRFDQFERPIKVRGDSELWMAPVCLVEAPNGFDERFWIDEVPTTVLPMRMSGGPIYCARRGFEDRLTPIIGNAVVLQPRGTPNYYHTTESVRFAEIALPDALIDKVGYALGASNRASQNLRDDIVFVPDQRYEIMAVDYVHRAFSGTEPASAIEMEARAMLITEHLLRHHHGLAPPQSAAARGGLAPWQVRRITEYMQENLDKDVTITELAGIAKLSPFHFARAFKRSLGAPPHAFHRNLRLERAKFLLAHGQMPVTEVAAQVGYEAPQTLARVFQREIGLSPSEWRRQCRK